MTRELNKQWRDDERPSFRKMPSNQHGDERFSRPARPRLSRAMVDRAWQDGAQHRHSDYHPRTTSSRPQSQNGRNGQRTPYSSSQSRPGNNRFNANYQENTQRFGHTQPDHQGPRSRSFEPDRRYTDDRRFGERRGYTERTNDRGYNDRSHDRGYDNNRPYNKRGTHNNYQNRGPQSYENRDRGRQFAPERPNREEHFYQQRPNSSRPADRRFTHNDAPHAPRRFSQDRPNQGHFEGDYEQFTSYNKSAPYTNRPRQTPPYTDRNTTQNRRAKDTQPEKPERHMTQMSDGRVLKGSRPEQRKNAQFWTEVAEDTDTLVKNVQVPQETALPEDDNIHLTKNVGKKQATASEKPKKRAASAVKRQKDATLPKTRSTGPKPSRRGFKWPSS